MPGLVPMLNIHRIFPKIAIIGFGKIAEAIAGGLAPLLDMQNFEVTSPSLCNGTRTTIYPVGLNNREAAKKAQLIILCTKPKDIPVVCREIAPVIQKDAVIMSMGAGISLDTMKENLPYNQFIFRIMTNTPIKQKLSVNAMIHTDNVPAELVAMVKAMLETVGRVVYLKNEAQFHAFTALYGCGPAYMFLILQYLEAAADKHGLMLEDKEFRRECLIQLMEGSAVLLKNEGLTFEKARANVTSKDGATDAAIKNFEKAGLLDLIHNGIDAATSRSEAMGKENAGSKATVSQLSVFKPEVLEAKQTSSEVPNETVSKKFGT